MWLPRLLLIYSASASWIRKQASVSPEGTLVLSTQAPIEDAAVWRLIQASGEAGTNLTELLRALRATRVDRISSESKAIRAQRVRQRAYHGAKGGDSNHSGFSPYVGVADVSKPLWSFHHPEVPSKDTRGYRRVFQGSPLIDADFNVYIQSTAGWIFSLDQAGELRWSFELDSDDGENPGNMVLLNGTAFLCTEDGVAWAIDLFSGVEKWRKKIAEHCSTDPFSLAAAKDLLVIPCNPADGIVWPGNMEGSSALCAVAAKDGSERWSYDFSRFGSKGFNMAPSIVNGSVYFNDLSGMAYALDLEDGTELWRQPGPGGTTFSTASSAVGHDQRLYNAFNMELSDSKGQLRCHDLAQGDLLWSRSFFLGLNAAPAIGVLRNLTMVVVALGDNPECLLEPSQGPPRPAEVQALDAKNGETLWSFTAPDRLLQSAAKTPEELCCTSLWSQPTVAADGRVYVNWAGGKLFSLLDANGDGEIDTRDPREFSFYQHGKGSSSQTAMVPHFMVAAACNQLMAYR